eukprot:scaffold116242_cov68-Phaeocystis_antarctica.AAC.1
MPRAASGHVYLVGARARAAAGARVWVWVWVRIRVRVRGMGLGAGFGSGSGAGLGVYAPRREARRVSHQAVSKACEPRGKSTAMLRLYQNCDWACSTSCAQEEKEEGSR